MKNFIFSTFFLFLAALNMSCKKEPHLIQNDAVYISPLFVQLEFRDTGQVDFTYEEYRLGSYLTDEEEPIYAWRQREEMSSNGPALQIDLMRKVIISETYLITSDTYRFGLKFWAGPDTAAPWTKQHLKDLFAPGLQYAFGSGPGRVDVSFEYPRAATVEKERSKASYLGQPEGQLEIVKTEAYSYGRPDGPRTDGLLVHCTFEGKLGRYDWAFDGSTENHTTDAALEIRNGEAAFFVKYD